MITKCTWSLSHSDTWEFQFHLNILTLKGLQLGLLCQWWNRFRQKTLGKLASIRSKHCWQYLVKNSYFEILVGWTGHLVCSHHEFVFVFVLYFHWWLDRSFGWHAFSHLPIYLYLYFYFHLWVGRPFIGVAFSQLAPLTNVLVVLSQKTAFSLVKSTLALGSPGWLFVCLGVRHHAINTQKDGYWLCLVLYFSWWVGLPSLT